MYLYINFEKKSPQIFPKTDTKNYSSNITRTPREWYKKIGRF